MDDLKCEAQENLSRMSGRTVGMALVCTGAYNRIRHEGCIDSYDWKHAAGEILDFEFRLGRELSGRNNPTRENLESNSRGRQTSLIVDP